MPPERASRSSGVGSGPQHVVGRRGRRGKAEVRLEDGRAVERPGRRVEFPGAEPAGLVRQPQPLLAPPELLLDELAVVDVDVDPDHAERGAVRGEEEPRLAGQPPPRAVGEDDTELVPDGLGPLFEAPPDGGSDGGRVVRHDPCDPRVIRLLERAAGDAVQVFQLRLPDDPALGDDPVEHAGAAGGLGQLQSLGGLPCGVLGTPPLGPLAGFRDRPLDGRGQVLEAVLKDVVGRAELERLDRQFLAQRAGDDQKRDFRPVLARQAQRLRPVDVGKLVVGQHHVERGGAAEVGEELGPPAGVRDVGREPRAGQPLRDQVRVEVAVFEVEDLGAHGPSGAASVRGPVVTRSAQGGRASDSPAAARSGPPRTRPTPGLPA